MDQLLPLASLAEAWGSRGEALGARNVKHCLSALLLRSLSNQGSRKGKLPQGSRPPNHAYASPSFFRLLACSHISTTRSRKGQSTNLSIVHQSATVPTFANWSSEMRPWP